MKKIEEKKIDVALLNFNTVEALVETTATN